ncbi:MAG TPA: hypothetical protein DCF33_09770 [Saprospirales bacterium]|nr:hypothetical protein [Saprospirales bacterium]
MKKFLISSQRHSVTASQRHSVTASQRIIRPSIRNTILFMVHFLVLGISSKVVAQPCDPQADFALNFGSGCDVSFLPVVSNGAHFWTFETVGTGVASGSNHPNPTHTFGAFTANLRRVTHTITIAGVTYSCTKEFYLNCNNGCDDRIINYIVNGCNVTFWSVYSGVVWDFGDGNFSTLPVPTHTYASSGTYIVSVSLANGTNCRKTITVDCSSSAICCTPNFTAEIRRECSELYLSLNAECTIGGTHNWSFSPVTQGACFDVANFFQGIPVQGMIQLTNINTCEMPAINVRHIYTCPNGSVLEQIQTIPINDPGIYIGINNTTTQLTDYNCVLPGASYNGGCTVYSTGYVEINKTFTFSNSLVKVHPGEAGFNVINSNVFTLNQNTEVSANMECSCLWRGIDVLNARMFTDTDATIKDALFAIRGRQKSRLDIKKTHFLKNFIGILATDGLFTLLSFEDNEFDGIGALKDICVLEPMIADILVPANSGSASSLQPLVPVFYSTNFGLSGLYMERYNLQLPSLALAQQNEFKNLAFGIMAFDGNIKIEQNCLFRNIPAIFSAIPKRSAGIFFVDRVLNGVNSFCFKGNNGGANDFQDCYQGMQIRSEQNIAPTRIGITNTHMNPVHTGIFLDSRFNGGEMIGQGNLGDFVGIKHNKIIANISGPALLSNVGISNLDYSPGITDLEISNNEVEVAYSSGLVAGGTTGITAHGAVGSDPGPGVVEVDIFENRVLVSNGAANGVGFSSHPNGWIRNNSGGNLAGGNGVFVTSGQSWSGIVVNGNSLNNLVACNDVTVLSGVDAGLLSVNMSQESQIIFNKLEGPGNGAHFEFDCSNAAFHCNEMIDNTIGLLYDNGAETGDQGTSSVTNGNKWLGTFSTWGAFADNSVIVFNSEIYVRQTMIGDEIPPSFDPINSWIIVTTDPNPTTNCLLDECPAPAPQFFMPEARFSNLDSLIALGVDTGWGAERVWQHEYNLWKKLTDHPELVVDNPVAEYFMVSRAGSNLDAFTALQTGIRNNLQVDEAQQNNLAALSVMANIEAEVFALDSLWQISEDSLERTQLQQDIAVLDAMYGAKKEEHQALCVNLKAQRLAAVGALMAQVDAIVPSNNSESNLASVYKIYLQTVVSGLEADSIQLADLLQIAGQCPWNGGPGVSYAAVLYQGFTGILPPSGVCNPVGERTKLKEPGAGLSLYPNPNTGAFDIALPGTCQNQSGWLRIFDARGMEVKSIYFDGTTSNPIHLNLSQLPSGIYMARTSCSGSDLAPVTFLLPH